MIKIYIADTAVLADETDFSMYMDRLDETRRVKAEQCKNSEDKKRSLLAGCLLQAGVKDWISEESGLQTVATPLSLSYVYGSGGKPYFKEYENIYFSLSHSGQYVICAFSDQEVGIDIQMHRKAENGIAQRFFSKEDRNMMTGILADRQDSFYMLWAAKESYMKLTGEGLKMGLDSTFLELEETREKDRQRGKIRLRNKAKAQKRDGAYIVLYDTIEKYSIAVCSYEKTADIDIKWICGSRL